MAVHEPAVAVTVGTVGTVAVTVTVTVGAVAFVVHLGVRVRVEEHAFDEEHQHVAEHDERVREGVLAAVLVLLAHLHNVG